MKKISVIMLTYNREQLVSIAIESLLNQTFDSFELIIIDNGSSDSSGAIADSYAAANPLIKVFHIPKSSIAVGRETGLRHACSELVTFVDDDDYFEPDMLAFLYNNIITANADISICGSYKVTEGVVTLNCVHDKMIIMDNQQAVIELLKRKKYNSGLPSKLFRKQLFNSVHFNADTKYEDIFVTYKLFAEATKIIYHGLPKYYCLRHHSNNSGCTTNDLHLTPSQLEEYFTAFRERTHYLSEKLPAIADFAQYSEWSYMISMCNKIESNELTGCAAQLAYVKDILHMHYHTFYESPYIEEFEKEWLAKYNIEEWGQGDAQTC